MYKFRDLKRVRAPSEGTRPIEAVCFNGHWLDDEIEAFETLNVEGRNDFKRSINAQELSEDGSIYLSSRIPAKQLKINFYWKTQNIEAYNAELKKLKSILYQPEVEIKFLDEKDFYHIGTVEEFALEDPTLTTKGTITINCSNPYKFSDVKEIESFDNQFTVNDNDLIYPNKPKKITIIPNADGSNVEIDNLTNGKKLMATLAFSKSPKIVFDFDNLDFSVDNVSHLIDLDLASNFDDFLIKNGDQIKINTAGTCQLEYEVKQL
ncbi:distal tail protein Dit [Lactobacillus helveticus]|uniref:distal tail protein Dit n=1 Tax=Lactobacillus helveticus TaxID=1587 RepID=UPI001C648860|nr:distal tail protein Dit [Lactobacillus helveticus]MBW7985196.1 hypothetical protein [Lactobacillus helveticus]